MVYQLCYSGRNNFIVMPLPQGQKYLSRNNFFIYSLMKGRLYSKMIFIMASSCLVERYTQQLLSLSMMMALMIVYIFWACTARHSMKELVTMSLASLKYRPSSGILETILNISVIRFTKQNKLSKVRLERKILFTEKCSCEAIIFFRNLQQLRMHCSLSQTSLESKGQSTYSSSNSQNQSLQMISRLATVSLLISLKPLLVFFVIALIKFLLSELECCSSQMSLLGLTLGSMMQSIRRCFSYYRSNSLKPANISINNNITQYEEQVRKLSQVGQTNKKQLLPYQKQTYLMSEQRPLTPRSPIKLNSKNVQSKKLYSPHLGHDGKLSEIVTTGSQISQRSEGEYEPHVHDFSSYKQHNSQTEQQVRELRGRLYKQQQKNYIFQHFFKKIEKVLYNENSMHLQGSEIKNYEKLQMHLQDMVKRIEKGSQYSKLAAVPVMYKKSNTFTTMTITSRNNGNGKKN